jgi:beta-glucosidase
MSTIKRRGFLRLSAAGFGALVAGQASAGCSQAPDAPQPTSTEPPTAAPLPTQTPAPAPTNPAAVAFPKDFIWGAGTSAYQIEGAYSEDGKGASIWDRFTHLPGKIKNNDNGDTAADHYHRYREDVALMKTIGLDAYRFSISWSRLLPSGRGKANPAGLDFYDRLVDALLEAGIQPFITLYVWDTPQALQDEGGWANRSIVDAFVEYTDLASRRLGDRVQAWATLNEPMVTARFGYEIGAHPPGLKNAPLSRVAAHHLLLAHARALPVLRQNSPQAQAGIVLNPITFHPASASLYDRREAWSVDGFINRWYLNPLAGRGYPAELILQDRLPMDFVKPGDLDEIAAPIDFVGINYYTRFIVRSQAVPEAQNLPVALQAGKEKTVMDWEVYPEGLHDLLCRLHFEYHFPSYVVSENGAAYPDQPTADGQVHDPERIRYLERHFQQAAKAIQAGVPLRAYYVWSLMDNFEWLDGFSRRFGLIYIDYATQKRILKDSALWYRDWIASQ